MTFIPSNMRARMDADLASAVSPREDIVIPSGVDRQLSSLYRNRLALKIAGEDTTDIDQAIADRLAL